MKLASVVMFAALASMLAAGCGGDGGGVTRTDGGRPMTGIDSGPVVRVDAAPQRPDTGVDAGQDAGMCVPSCMTDIQCQSSCPAIRPGTTGAHCCDRATNMCYVYSMATCPARPQDAGMMMMY